ncbi:MAG: SDR family NAD(P)-dependent oxidoreductase [Isosphaeraceae bacterium]
MARFFELGGQVALVTGGGRGIGAEVARRLADAGALVAILDRHEEDARQVAGEVEGIAVLGDVRSESDVAMAVATTEEALGPLSILINNAGITGRAAPAWEIEPAEVREVMEVNFLGAFLCARAALPGMRARGYGRIVSIASIAGKEGNPNLLAYSASKAAVIAMTKAMAKEVAGQGDITINAIAPAVIRTPLLDGLPEETIAYMVSKIPIGRTGRPEELASLVHYLASPEASFCTGQCYDLSGGRATY